MKDEKTGKVIRCPGCHKTHIVRLGFSHQRRGIQQRLKCIDCGRSFNGKLTPRPVPPVEKPTNPTV